MFTLGSIQFTHRVRSATFASSLVVSVFAMIAASPKETCAGECVPAEEWTCVNGGSGVEGECDISQSLCRIAHCFEYPESSYCEQTE
jgi:hypothetical protein